MNYDTEGSIVPLGLWNPNARYANAVPQPRFALAQLRTMAPSQHRRIIHNLLLVIPN